MAKLLIVDDEERILSGFSRALTEAGHDVKTAGSVSAAIEVLAGSDIDIVMTDLVMPEAGGIDLLKHIKHTTPDIPVIIITGHGTVETAVQAMKFGAYDYISKPFNLDEVEVAINRSIEHKKLLAENISLKNQLRKQYAFDNIIGDSSAAREMFSIIDRVRDTKSTVLITGRSGAGKELVAKAIHYNGILKDRPFVTVNCAALSENLLENELFGHEKGAFTGAHREKKGYFEEADGGTIFLDEIGEFSLGLQSRLLRVLQEGEFSRVGESVMRKVDVRVIAATNRDLDEMVEEGTFREDLFYRLNVITINVPSLSDRIEDIPSLVEHFVAMFNDKLHKRLSSVSDDVMNMFANYSWPGNIRELENIMERVMTFCDERTLEMKHFPDSLRNKLARKQESERTCQTMESYSQMKEKVLEEFTKNYISELLSACGGNISAASKTADLDRGRLYRLLKKYGIDK